jgi:hypothetical protein
MFVDHGSTARNLRGADALKRVAELDQLEKAQASFHKNRRSVGAADRDGARVRLRVSGRGRAACPAYPRQGVRIERPFKPPSVNTPKR